MGIIPLALVRPHWCVTEDGPNLLHDIAERGILGVMRWGRRARLLNSSSRVTTATVFPLELRMC